MSSYASKTQGNQSRVSADCSPKQQSSPPAMQFINNRPDAVAQRKLQSAANNGPQVKQFKALQQMADERPVLQRALISSPAAAGTPVIQRLTKTQHQALLDQEKRYRMPVRTGWVQEGWMGSDLVDDERLGYGERKNLGKMTSADKIRYGMMGLTGSTAGASRAKDTYPLRASHLPAAALTGGISAGLGAVNELYAASQTRKGVTDKANDSASKRLAFLDTTSSVLGAGKSAATSALNISDYVKSTASTAITTTTAAGASVAIGAAEMLGGAYGAYVATRRKAGIEGILSMDVSADTRLAGRMASATQGREQVKGAGKIIKGAAGIAGGAMLLAGALTPVGWGLLAGAAVIGVAASIINAIKKRRHKKDVVIDILGIRERRDRWKKAKEKVEALTRWRSDARKAQMAAIGEDPLQVALANSGYKDVAHCYDNYVVQVSKHLYVSGVRNSEPDSVMMLKNLGFEIDMDMFNQKKWDKRSKITPEKIAKKLVI